MEFLSRLILQGVLRLHLVNQGLKTFLGISLSLAYMGKKFASGVALKQSYKRSPTVVEINKKATGHLEKSKINKTSETPRPQTWDPGPDFEQASSNSLLDY